MLHSDIYLQKVDSKQVIKGLKKYTFSFKTFHTSSKLEMCNDFLKKLKDFICEYEKCLLIYIYI